MILCKVHQKEGIQFCWLCYSNPQKVLINDLFDEYYVSNTVITNDLVRMNEFLLKYQLSLIRKGQRVSIEGTEKHIRKAVNHLISANRVWEEDFSTQQEKSVPMTSTLLLRY